MNKPPHPPQKSRAEMIVELQAVMETVRTKLDPELLARAERLIHATSLQPVQKDRGTVEETVKIDRERNVKFVMDFLNSPAGARLKAKLFP